VVGAMGSGVEVTRSLLNLLISLRTMLGVFSLAVKVSK